MTMNIESFVIYILI